MTTFTVNTVLTMYQDHAERIGTIKPPTVIATVLRTRPNVFGGVSYMLKFDMAGRGGGKSVTVFRSLTDHELAQRNPQVVAKPKRARKPQPRKVTRTGVSQLKKAG